MPTQFSLTLSGLLVALVMVACMPDANSETTHADSRNSIEESGIEKVSYQSVPFLTLRNRTGDDEAANYFGGERSFLQAGYCKLSRTPINTLKSIADKAPFHIPDEIVKLDAISELPVQDFWQRMENSSNQQAPVMYLHGFHISFERGCRRALVLKESLGLAGRFLLFIWPSDGAITNYTHDEADLYWSVYPLREVLTDMINRFGKGNINVVAHSLGTRGVMLSLVLLAQIHKDDEPLINNVVLIAPDIDVGIFKQYLPLIRPLARNMTVYASSNDSPLALSRQVHGYVRLGEAGEHLEDLQGLEIIDISDVPMRAPSGHVYHLNQDIVIEDLDQLINGNKQAAQRNNLKQVGKNQWQWQQAESE